MRTAIGIILGVVGVWMSVRANGFPGTMRYYAPLDKFSRNEVLLSRDKEISASREDFFPFPKSEYDARMAEVPYGSRDRKTRDVLEHLMGEYFEKMADVLGAFNEQYPIFSEVFRNAGVSENYALLAPMLSGMDRHYVSQEGKRGVWQLDLITATRYGLRISDWADDRNDPIISAKAAALYIKDLERLFKNPKYVLWAYVASPAEVIRAQGRAISDSDEDVGSALGIQISMAVPVFSAWNFVWYYADKERLPIFVPKFFLPYENAITSGKTHLGQIAEVLDVSLSLLKEINPKLKKQFADSLETVHVPVGYAHRFLEMAEKISAYKDSIYFRPVSVLKPDVAYTSVGNSSVGATTVKKYHHVRSGETLSRIAGKYRVSVSNIRKWNSLSSNTIRAGQRLVVQVTVVKPPPVQIDDAEDRAVRENFDIEKTVKDEIPDQEAKPEDAVNKEIVPTLNPEPKKIVPKAESAWIRYVVRAGDTLSSIGRKYGVPYQKIKEWNGLRSDSLTVGQKLKIKK